MSRQKNNTQTDNLILRKGLEQKQSVLVARQHPPIVAGKSPELEELKDLQYLEGVLHSPERYTQVSLRIFWAACWRLNDEADRKALRWVFEADEAVRAVSALVFPEESRRRALIALDEAICEQAREIGARIHLSRRMRSRIVEWDDEPNGAELQEKLGEALAKQIRISRRHAKAPVDLKRLKTARPRLVDEVKRLRQLLRGRLTQARLPNDDDIRSTAARLITGPGHGFFLLKVNVAIVLEFDQRPQDNNEENPEKILG